MLKTGKPFCTSLEMASQHTLRFCWGAALDQILLYCCTKYSENAAITHIFAHFCVCCWWCFSYSFGCLILHRCPIKVKRRIAWLCLIAGYESDHWILIFFAVADGMSHSTVQLGYQFEFKIWHSCLGCLYTNLWIYAQNPRLIVVVNQTHRSMRFHFLILI